MAVQDYTITLKAENLVQQAIDEAIKAFKDLGQTSQLVTDRLSNAFKTLDIKSAFDIGNEKNKIIAAFDQIEKSGVASANEINRARDAMKSKLAELDAAEQGHARSMDKHGASLDGLFGKVGAGIVVFNNLLQAGQTVAGMFGSIVSESVKASLQNDQLAISMKTVTGSTKAAAAELAFVREAANKLGLDVVGATQGMIRMASAAKDTSMEGEPVRQLFLGLTSAVTALNLPADRASSIMNQFGQALAKNKIQAEDMNIIAEAGIPIYKLLADATGTTTQAFQAQMAAGKALGIEVLEKLGPQLQQAYGKEATEAANSAQAAINRFNNSVRDSKAAFGESLIPALMSFTETASLIAPLFTETIKEIMKLGPTVGLVFDTAAATVKRMFGLISEADFKKQTDDYEAAWNSAMTAIEAKFTATSASAKKSDQEVTDEAERNAKRRVTENAIANDLMVKAAQGYGKAVGEINAEIAASYAKSQVDGRKDIEEYYASRQKAFITGSEAEKVLIGARNEALKQFDAQHARDAELAVFDTNTKILQGEREGIDSRIAVIKEGMARNLISQEQGNREIIDLQKQQAKKEYDNAAAKFDLIKELYGTDTKEYQASLKAKENAAQNVGKTEVDGVKAANKAKSDAYSLDLARYGNSLKEQELELKTSLDKGLITQEEYNRKKLVLEKEHAEKVLAIRTSQVNEINPETQAKEYEAALSLKLDAEKRLADATTAIQKEALQEQTRAVKTETEQQMVFVGDFNAWFKQQWQTAVDTGAKVLSGFSDAVYNVFAGIYELPQKLTEDAASLMAQSRKAAAEAKTLWDEQHGQNLRYGGSLADVFDRLTKITVTVKELTAQFLAQKSEALTLADALGKPANITQSFANYAADALSRLNLLDQSTLDKVKGEIDKIKQTMKDFTDQAKSALQVLQEEWNDLFLTSTDKENLKYQQQKLDLELNYQEAVKQGNIDAQTAIKASQKLLDDLHNKRMKDLGDEADKSNLIVTGYENGQPVYKKKMAWGGKLPGGDSAFDSVPVLARPGEWFIRNESASFWGDGVMQAINEPFSRAGQYVTSLLSGMVPQVPKFAYGGAVGGGSPSPESRVPSPGNLTVNIYTQRLDESTVRREVIPVLEKYTQLKA